MRAQVEHHIRRAFNHHRVIVSGLLRKRRKVFLVRIINGVDGDHPFALRIKGDFLLARVSPVEFFGQGAGLFSRHQDGPFRRVAHHAHAVIRVFFQCRIVVQRADP